MVYYFFYYLLPFIIFIERFVSFSFLCLTVSRFVCFGDILWHYEISTSCEWSTSTYDTEIMKLRNRFSRTLKKKENHITSTKWYPIVVHAKGWLSTITKNTSKLMKSNEIVKVFAKYAERSTIFFLVSFMSNSEKLAICL